MSGSSSGPSKKGAKSKDGGGGNQPSPAWKETTEQLLGLLAANNVEIPASLKESIQVELGKVSGVSETKGGAPAVGGDRRSQLERSGKTHADLLHEGALKKSSAEDDALVRQIQDSIFSRLNRPKPELKVRIEDGSYTVFEKLNADGKGVAENVISSGPFYKLYRLVVNLFTGHGSGKVVVEKPIMKNVHLCLETGKMYLVLGSPGSGKSTLLKMIADTLQKGKNAVVGGHVSIDGVVPGKEINWSKLVSYIDQIDRLHAYLTVHETFAFAWKCRTGGTHRLGLDSHDPQTNEIIAEMDAKEYLIGAVMDGLGLTRVKDTFVGDQQRVRGVSGGEKKRVTVGEMFCCPTIVRCCDEISTGLDAATTFDITRLLGVVNRMTERICIISLLQPPPETVALFDEVILVSEGMVLFCGPIGEVQSYFNNLGYFIPERMDLADWLQLLPTPDGAQFLQAHNSGGSSEPSKHMTSEEFHQKFYESELGMTIKDRLKSPTADPQSIEGLESFAKTKYENPWYKSLKLLIRRELLLWWRDQYAIKAKVIQTIIMGVVVGTVFFQQSTDPRIVVSVMFQSLFYMLIGAMVLVRTQFFDRPIFYKQQDAKFFPTWSYVLGRSVSAVPIALIDAVGYGSFIFWLVGLAYNDGASIANYFIFMLLLFVTSLTSGLLFSVFSSSMRDITAAQASIAILALFAVLFSGYTVQPDVIPGYYIWIYWLNCFAWLLRALAINEFLSGKFNSSSTDPEYTQGELALIRLGFTLNGEPFDFAWVWWGILFAIATAFVSMMISTFILDHKRFATGMTPDTSLPEDVEVIDAKQNDIVSEDLPFSRGTFTFKNMHYSVTSSITKDTLELLKGVDGVLEAGKMTALMGSSGAGKTTLMDVLALRKTSGTIEGDVRLNGHHIDPSSFRRCTGYVEQFDTQSAQLTIKETVEFSARLRLDESKVSNEVRERFIVQTLSLLELTSIQHLRVGSDDTGGLSFEQRKRLSIAVELVANPTVLFLDEPTSGLDARAAAIVMRGMKRIALTGRTICATIHQPSVAIFNEFDSLLLLKRGGEVVFHGPIGKDSCELIKYFEKFEVAPKILPGENPATWMLKVIGAGSATTGGKPFDFAGSYAVSDLHAQCLKRIDEVCSEATENNKIVFDKKYAASTRTQYLTVFKKGWLVYFRSPSYNTVRMIVSGFIALLFASVYASQRTPTNESDMISRINSIYISVLFICVNAQNTVLGVFENERNMYYRHKSANMYSSTPVLIAYTLAELPFIILTGTMFSVLFYFIMGFEMSARSFFLFFIFITLSVATYTFQGQMLVSLVKDSKTAQGFGSLLLSFSSLFSGVLIPPQDIPPFWIFMYWIMPGHYIMEGLFTSQYASSELPIEASVGSPFFYSLGCNQTSSAECTGTAGEWLAVSFPTFSEDHIKWDATFLAGLIVLTRIVSWYALTNLNYRSN